MVYGQVECPDCEKCVPYKGREPRKLMSPVILFIVAIWAMTYVLPIEYKELSLSVIAPMCLTIQMLRGLKSPNSHACSHCGCRWEEVPKWKV
jgi:hypothetical protein